MRKKLILHAVLVIIVSVSLLHGSSQALAQRPTGRHTISNQPILEIQPDPLVQQIINQVTSEQVYAYTEQITGVEPVWVDGDWYTIESRDTYSGESIQKAGRWVGQHMQDDLGFEVEYHAWDDETNPNVIGEIEGLTNPDDIFIIGGHLDDVWGTPGADDNGSGSVATLIAADILSQYQWGCTLRFAFWTGEEQWMLGSEAYAQRSADMGENIVGYLNLDMIAWNTIGSDPGIDLYYQVGMPETFQFTQLFADAVYAYELDLLPHIKPDQGLGSDQAPFWDYGYNAMLAIEDEDGDLNPFYHTAGDNISHIDLDYFTDFTRAALATFVHFNDCLITSGLDGTVTAAGSGEPLAGVGIVIQNSAGDELAVETDLDGYYSQPVFVDVYTVTAALPGYFTEVVTGVEVISGTVTTLDFELEPKAAPVAEFTSSSPAMLGELILFTNTTTGTLPIVYEWDFGDGTGVSVQENPVYTYTAARTYTVTLTAQNEAGVDTVEHVVVVEEQPTVIELYLPFVGKDR